MLSVSLSLSESQLSLSVKWANKYLIVKIIITLKITRYMLCTVSGLPVTSVLFHQAAPESVHNVQTGFFFHFSVASNKNYLVPLAKYFSWSATWGTGLVLSTTFSHFQHVF